MAISETVLSRPEARTGETTDTPTPPADTLTFGRLLIALIRLIVRHAPARAAGMVVLIVSGGVLEGLRLLLLVPIIDVLAQRGVGPLWVGWLRRAGAETAATQLAVMMAAFLVASSLRAATYFLRDTGMARLQTELVNAERTRIIRRIAGAPWHQVMHVDSARITGMVGVEAARLGSSVDLVMQSANNIAMLAIQLAVAFVLSPMLAAATLAMLVTGAIVTVRRQGGTIASGQLFAQASQHLTTTTARFAGSLKAAIAQDAQAGFIAEFDAAQDDVRARQLAYAMKLARRSLWISVGSTAAASLVIVGGFGLFGTRLAVLMTMMFVFVRMAGPVSRIQSAVQSLAFALPGFRSIATLATELADQDDSDDAALPSLPGGPITLADVTYRHPGGGGIAGATMTLDPGAYIGIMGPSGHGKTTLVDLLAGLLPPQSGTVSIGAARLTTTAARRAWRRRIGYVTQDGFLFNDTLRRNLAWGNEATGDDAMIAALATTGATPLLQRLGGLDAMLGERGMFVSGGERQRIAIARALLRRPRLLLLDEATSAIDVASEADLIDRLAVLHPRPTIVLVSHRADSMKRCDDVLHVRDGRLHREVPV